MALEADAQPFEEDAIERVLRAVADERRIKAASLIHAARIAATGKGVSPGIFEVLALLGKPLTVNRLRDLVRYLRDSASLP
jgi:glutamyl-tRNA synthetase